MKIRTHLTNALVLAIAAAGDAIPAGVALAHGDHVGGLTGVQRNADPQRQP